MKRDMDLVRLILQTVEKEGGHKELHLDGYDDTQVGHHCYLLGQAGLLEVADTSSLSSSVSTAIPIALTWDGHDFLDAASDSTLWARAKTEVIGPAGGVAFSVLLEWLKAEGRRALGLPP